MDHDLAYLRKAIHLAREAQRAGNLPIGAVITLDGEIVAQGQNGIWVPTLSPGRHAEIEALAALPRDLLPQAQAMTLYTTLEPCLMCTATILVHRIGRVVFGSYDERGGATSVFGHMPPAFERLKQDVEWVGPVLPQECDALCVEAFRLLEAYQLRAER
jgi:tRNA(adenine34) deaminase